jgi:hypothetical protein
MTTTHIIVITIILLHFIVGLIYLIHKLGKKK